MAIFRCDIFNSTSTLLITVASNLRPWGVAARTSQFSRQTCHILNIKNLNPLKPANEGGVKVKQSSLGDIHRLGAISKLGRGWIKLLIGHFSAHWMTL